ncbi:MAG: hypothetical protein MR270_01910 [Erysipelotrichaceae bacterium]|nr:hypothetical protein [Erysipelotrichaceae bacterium]
MNKYQEFAIKSAVRFDYDRTDKNVSLASFEWDYKTVTIVQNENYNIKKYNIYLLTAVAEKVEYVLNGQTHIVKEIEKNKYQIELDYDNRIEKINIHFSNGVVDPVEISIVYVEADVKKYNEKVMAEHKKALEEKANVKVTTGDSIINVAFQPVNGDFSYSKVELYIITGTKVVNNKTEYEYQLMAKYKTPEDVYFHSITGLAYGRYAIILVQYDNSNKEIYKSDYIRADLNEPAGRKRWVVTPSGGRYI